MSECFISIYEPLKSNFRACMYTCTQAYVPGCRDSNLGCSALLLSVGTYNTSLPGHALLLICMLRSWLCAFEASALSQPWRALVLSFT